MESAQSSMNISWVVSNKLVLDPTIDINTLKDIGSFWGSWQTWRACSTDNVICHDGTKAKDLLARDFHLNCNFYLPNSLYQFLERPQNVRLYEGDFKHDVDNRDELIAMNLAATGSDVVLLLGFDFTELPEIVDRLEKHRALNYQNLFGRTVLDNPQTQWVLVDHPGDLAKNLTKISNLTQDTLSNVVDMLKT